MYEHLCAQLSLVRRKSLGETTKMIYQRQTGCDLQGYEKAQEAGRVMDMFMNRKDALSRKLSTSDCNSELHDH